MLRVRRKDLLQAAKLMATLIERRTTIPVLSFLGIRCKDGVVTVQHKGIDGHLSTRFEGDGDDLPEVLVPGHRLVKSLSLMNGFVLTIRKLGDGRVEIANESRGTVLRFMGLSPDDCPDTMQGAKPTFKATLPMGVLQQVVSGVKFAVSTEETRYYLNGIAFGVDGDALSASATDGHRLMQRRITLPPGSITGKLTGSGAEGRLIIPRMALPAILAMSTVESDAILSFYGRDDNGPATMFEVVQAHTVLRHKLIDGTFPDIDRVIPKGLSAFVEFSAREFLSCCGATFAAIDARDSGGRAMQLVADAGRLGMRVAGPDTTIIKDGAGKDVKIIDDEATSQIKASIVGEFPEKSDSVGFNGRYLMDMVGAFGPGKVRLYLNGIGGPAYIESDAGSAAGRGVLMPMRTTYDWRPEPLAA